MDIKPLTVPVDVDGVPSWRPGFRGGGTSARQNGGKQHRARCAAQGEAHPVGGQLRHEGEQHAACGGDAGRPDRWQVAACHQRARASAVRAIPPPRKLIQGFQKFVLTTRDPCLCYRESVGMRTTFILAQNSSTFMTQCIFLMLVVVCRILGKSAELCRIKQKWVQAPGQAAFYLASVATFDLFRLNCLQTLGHFRPVFSILASCQLSFIFYYSWPQICKYEYIMENLVQAYLPHFQLQHRTIFFQISFGVQQ